MKYLSILLFILLQIPIHSSAQTPNWAVDVNAYQYSMSLTAFISIDGEVLRSTEDKVAVFNGNTCRGVTNLIYIEAVDKYLAYLTIYANTDHEILTFKIYKAEENKIVEVQKTLSFELNEHYGNVFQSYSIAEPTLNSEANLSVSFEGIDILSEQVIGDTLYYVVDYDADITSLVPTFSVSDGADMYQERHQMSSMNGIAMDFTEAMTVDIMSEDQSTMKTYTILVTNRYANSEAEILSFTIDELLIDSSIDENSVWLLLPFGTEINDVTVEFEVSDMAILYYQDSALVSGQQVDLTLGDSLTVISENQLGERSYRLDIEFSPLGDGIEAQATNVVTPNKDGYNDYWVVNEIDRLREATFQIYTINGTLIYESVGYDNSWDGTYRGQPLPVGNYYYSIRNKESNEHFTGDILIVY